MKFVILTKLGSYVMEADSFKEVASEAESQEGDDLMGIFLVDMY